MIRNRSYLINSLWCNDLTQLSISQELGWSEFFLENLFFRKPLYHKYFRLKYFYYLKKLTHYWYLLSLTLIKVYKFLFFTKWNCAAIPINCSNVELLYKFNPLLFHFFLKSKLIFFVPTVLLLNLLLIPQFEKLNHSSNNKIILQLAELFSTSEKFKYFKYYINNLWFFKLLIRTPLYNQSLFSLDFISVMLLYHTKPIIYKSNVHLSSITKSHSYGKYPTTLYYSKYIWMEYIRQLLIQIAMLTVIKFKIILIQLINYNLPVNTYYR